MSKALPGENYCQTHQGNHSHYDPINCTVCRLEKRIKELEDQIFDMQCEEEEARNI